MELGGLEPPTSWVRLHPVQFALVKIGLIERNQIRPILPDSLSLVARLVARPLRRRLEDGLKRDVQMFRFRRRLRGTRTPQKGMRACAPLPPARSLRGSDEP